MHSTAQTAARRSPARCAVGGAVPKIARVVSSTPPRSVCREEAIRLLEGAEPARRSARSGAGDAPVEAGREPDSPGSRREVPPDPGRRARRSGSRRARRLVGDREQARFDRGSPREGALRAGPIGHRERIRSRAARSENSAARAERRAGRARVRFYIARRIGARAPRACDVDPTPHLRCRASEARSEAKPSGGGGAGGARAVTARLARAGVAEKLPTTASATRKSRVFL